MASNEKEELILHEVRRYARQMARGLRFLGVCFVLMALPYAATGYGLVVAWAPVWLGVLLWQAGASAGGVAPDLPRMMRKLRAFVLGFSLLATVLLLFAGAMALTEEYTVVSFLQRWM